MIVDSGRESRDMSLLWFLRRIWWKLVANILRNQFPNEAQVFKPILCDSILYIFLFLDKRKDVPRSWVFIYHKEKKPSFTDILSCFIALVNQQLSYSKQHCHILNVKYYVLSTELIFWQSENITKYISTVKKKSVTSR